MLSQGEATLRSTFYFLNTEGCRGKRAVQARAAKREWGVPAPRFGLIATPAPMEHGLDDGLPMVQ